MYIWKKGFLLIGLICVLGSVATAQTDSAKKSFFFSQYKFSLNHSSSSGFGVHSEFGWATGRFMPSIGLGYEFNYYTRSGKKFTDDTLHLVQQVPLYITHRTAIYRNLIYLITTAGILKTINDKNTNSNTGVLLFAGVGANGIKNPTFLIEAGVKVLSFYDGVNNRRYTSVLPSISKIKQWPTVTL